MNGLSFQIIGTVNISSDSDKNVEVLNAMLDSQFRVRSMDRSEMILERNLTGEEFLKLIKKGGTVPPVRPESPSPAESTPKKRRGRPPKNDEAPVSDSSSELLCAICGSNRVRSDNKGCLGCGRRVCKECRAHGSSREGHCIECAATLPDRRAHNGGARPNSGPTPKPKRMASDHAGNPLPDPKLNCDSCHKFKAAVKCAGCAKNICGLCVRRLNGQCSECASVPA